jgi:hypothetical protein
MFFAQFPKVFIGVFIGPLPILLIETPLSCKRLFIPQLATGSGFVHCAFGHLCIYCQMLSELPIDEQGGWEISKGSHPDVGRA